MITQTPANTVSSIISSQNTPSHFWERIGIFPKLIISPKKRFEQSQKSFSKNLKRIGLENLKFIAQRVGLDMSKEDSVARIVDSIISRDAASHTLLFLTLFLKGPGRLKALNAIYNEIIPARKQREIEGDLQLLSGKTDVQVKSLVKALVLYDTTPSNLLKVYVRSCWRSRRSKPELEFYFKGNFQRNDVSQCKLHDRSLEEKLAKLPPSLSLRLEHEEEIDKGHTVFLIQREKLPSPRPDFKKNYVVVHPYHLILVGVDNKRKRIRIKGGNENHAKMIIQWIEECTQVSVEKDNANPIQDFDASIVQSRLQGEFPPDSPISLHGINFLRTNVPGKSSLAISSLDSQPIHDAISLLASKGVVRFRSFSDISEITVAWDNESKRSTKIKIINDLWGNGVFRLGNAGLDEKDEDVVNDLFQQLFSIPLNRAIAALNLPLGPVDGYREILRGGLREKFPREYDTLLDRLISEKLISETVNTYQVCSNRECRAFDQEVTDKNLLSIIGTCKDCCEDLTERKKFTILRENAKVAKVAKFIAGEALGFSGEKIPITREGVDFFRINDTESSNNYAYVTFVQNLDKNTEQIIDRFSEPVFVFYLFGETDRILYDSAKAIVYVDFSYALTSIFKKDNVGQNETDIWSDFQEDFCVAFQQLKRGKPLRIKKAAECSRERIENIPKEDKGNLFEIDVFNLIKAVFHHSSRWGGPLKPDGFSTLSFFRRNDLNEEDKLSWSYDAKYSDSENGYSFGIDEKRKVRDYVMNILDQKAVNVQRNRYLAHVIISNNIKSKPLSECVRYLQDEKVFEKAPEFNLVFMELGFLLSLYDDAMKNYDEIKKRANYLPEFVADAMKNKKSGENLAVLNIAKAKEVIAKVLEADAVETPPDTEKIKKGMKNS